MRAVDLLKNTRKFVSPPYGLYEVFALLGALIILLAIPLTAVSIGQRTVFTASADIDGLVSRINSYRASKGLATLAQDQKLVNAACWMANDMATKNYHSHTDSLGRNTYTRLAAFGVGTSYWRGETLAAGTSTGLDAFNVWKNSPAHNSVLLNPNFTRIGVGAAYKGSSSYGYYWVADFASGSATPVTNQCTIWATGPPTSDTALSRLDIFALGSNHKMHHKWYQKDYGWGPAGLTGAWESLGVPEGVTFKFNPGAVSWDYGRIDVFARGSDSNKKLWHKWYDKSRGWSGWENLGGILNSGPDVSSWGKGRLDVFALGSDNKLWHKWYVKGKGWYAWKNLGAPSGKTLTFDPGAVSWGGGRIDVFARGSDKHLWHKWYDKSRGWSGWENLGGILNSGPDVSSWGKGRLDVFALGSDNKLWHKWYERGKGWKGWESLGAPSGQTLLSNPSAVSWGGGRVDVFARGKADNKAWHKWYVRGQGWSSWESLGGVLSFGPDAASWTQ